MPVNCPIAKFVLLDSGFWIALYDPADGHHSAARELLGQIDGARLVLPWPILYEVLRTRFVRRRDVVRAFVRRARAPQAEQIDDAPYREQALAVVFDFAAGHERPVSLVDMVLRLMLDDVALRIDGLVTFNVRDFADVCRRRRIEILP